jgi:hypothetical protein
MLLRDGGKLSELLDRRTLNELEQDRIDPRTLPNYPQLVIALEKALGVDRRRLEELAADHERAALYQHYYRQRLEQEAIAFRARTVRG